MLFKGYRQTLILNTKRIQVDNVPPSQGPLTIQELKLRTSTLIEWDMYPDELKSALKECWTMQTGHPKALRLAAPLVCLMQSKIVSTPPNYAKIKDFFIKELSISIDNSQLGDECRLLLNIIKDPSNY